MRLLSCAMIAVMLCSCGLPQAKPRQHESRLAIDNDAGIGSAKENPDQAKNITELALKDSAQDCILPKTVEISQKPTDGSFGKMLESCREIKPSLTSFEGELLQTGIQCERIQFKCGRIIKDVSAMSNVVSDYHGRVIEDDDGQILFMHSVNSSHSGNMVSSIIHDQAHSDDGEKMAYIDEYSGTYELGILDLATMEKKVYIKTGMPAAEILFMSPAA